MSIRRAELCIARALARPLNRLLRHGGGWLFWGVWGASGLHMLGRYQKRYTQPPAGERQAAAPPHVGGWVGRLGINAKLRAAGGGGVMRYHGFMHFLPFFSAYPLGLFPALSAIIFGVQGHAGTPAFPVPVGNTGTENRKSR